MAIARKALLSVIVNVVAIALLSVVVNAKVFFQEQFDDGWETRWVKSNWKNDEGEAGDWLHTAGKWYGDPSDKGIQTHPDSRFFAISAGFPEFDNKEKPLVLQFSVKHEQDLDCGGGYVKLLGGDVDQSSFSGDTPYSIMFGPDICGYNTKRVHVILNYKGENHPIEKEIPCEEDRLTHVYTLVIKPGSTYTVFIDNEERKSGSLYKDWKILPPRKIEDPMAKKPEDWDEVEFLDDPEDKKPEGYDDILKEIPDPEAEKPEDWDEEEDGEWKAPIIPNPEYTGPWKPKQMKNPNYKGKWKAPMINNPDFEDDPELYVFKGLKYVGIELWQVKSGSLFDNILITDDLEYAKKFAQETWGKHKEAEKKMFSEAEKKKKEDDKVEEPEEKSNEEDSHDEL